MPKRVLPLTDLKVKTAKPKANNYKLSDGGGLYLLVTPSGGNRNKIYSDCSISSGIGNRQ